MPQVPVRGRQLHQLLGKLRALRANIGDTGNFPERSTRQRADGKYVRCRDAVPVDQRRRRIDVESEAETVGSSKTLRQEVANEWVRCLRDIDAEPGAIGYALNYKRLYPVLPPPAIAHVDAAPPHRRAERRRRS